MWKDFDGWILVAVGVTVVVFSLFSARGCIETSSCAAHADVAACMKAIGREVER